MTGFWLRVFVHLLNIMHESWMSITN